MKKAKQWKKPEVGVREFTNPSSKSVLSSSGVRSFVGHPVGPPSAPSPATNDLSLEGR